MQESPPAPQQQQQNRSPRSSLPHSDHVDSDDGGVQFQSGEDADNDYEDQNESLRNGKRKRPISVSCELCKQRKVKCDRGRPLCGWCHRNGAVCEYKERKKPGLRAGYGRELEQRLDKLEEILRSHAEILRSSLAPHSHQAQHGSPGSSSNTNHSAILNPPSSVRDSNASLPSEHGTPWEAAAPPPVFPRAPEALRTPQAETALFLQKPSTFPTAPQAAGFGLPAGPHSLHEGYPTMAGISPTDMTGGGVPPTAAAQEYYGAGPTPRSSFQPPTLAVPSQGVPPRGQGQVSADHDLPPYDLLYALADLYFKHINTWCPILHRKTTLDSLFGTSIIGETDRVLLHAIVATTLRYSTDARLTEGRRRHYHSISKQRVLLHGMENSSVKALQALVILALDLCGDSNGPPGWNIMALITRSVVQLGLAVEANSFSVSPHYTSIYTLRAMILPEPRDFVEEESRRRLFWMVFLLDRYATISTAFDFALDDKEIDRKLPCRDDLWIKNQKVETRWFRTEETRARDESAGSIVGSPGYSAEHEANRPENLGAFSYYIEVLGILSRIHKFLKQPVDISSLSDVEAWQMKYKELDSALATWKFGLPGEYGNMAKLFQPGSAKALNCEWVMLHATYHTAVIRLHSSAAYPTTRSPIFAPSYSASQRCHGAVENIAALGEFVLGHNLLAKLGPPFAFTLWVAARLLLVHGSTVERKLSPRIPFFVDALREMGRYWPVAARYCGLLQRVLDEHRGSERQGDGVTPSSVRILADMRRTAFDLDLLISRQPRHAPAAPDRSPPPSELEYLDVFDFFNVPRLPLGAPPPPPPPPPGNMPGDGAVGGTDGIGDPARGAAVGGEFNITDFTIDMSRDWLFEQGGPGKFV